MAQERYEPTWQSLERHVAVPEWMRDAKFGIYCHWGVYTVPAYGNEQYFHYMHDDGVGLMNARQRHEQMYGPLTQFGYHDFIPMFKAEKFNADEWAEMFRSSGARFAGLVGEHHDGFSMWDSKYTPFNAKKMGPKRDIVGELSRSIRQRGMKFFLSLHHENNYYYVKVKQEWAANNPKYAKMYGCLMPRAEWYDMWLNKSKEVVSKYSPDIIYFDAWMDSIPEQKKLDFLAHYFNHAQQTGQEVIFTYKYKEFPRSIGMLDHEMSNPDQIDPIPWLCDYTISTGYHSSWGYVRGMQYRSHRDIIQKLVEVVSNNGQLLLNLSPMADGTFPQEQKDIVENVGVWLWSYGESIYGTRPFVVSHETTATGERVCYTRKGNYVYVIFLDWPGTEKPQLLTALKDDNLKGQVTDATLLSVKRNFKCRVSQGADGLTLTIPQGSRIPSDAAYVIRLHISHL
ncbi:MAG: alpha-L-fucosidase [Prevotella sp.]|nr:alpha-L-fucosidase [Prevotella sp.]